MTLGFSESPTHRNLLELNSRNKAPVFQSGNSVFPYARRMRFDARIRKHLDQRGWKIAELGRRIGIAPSDQASLDRLYKIVQGKVDNPRGNMLADIAKVLDTTELELRYGEKEGAPRVPIIGHAGASETWTSLESDAAAPAIVDLSLEGDEAVAVEVAGDSMLPAYRKGDVLIGSRLRGTELRKAIGSDCIVETVHGDRYVKVLMKGSAAGRFRLRSYNPVHGDIEDVMLEWAAPVEIVKRARA